MKEHLDNERFKSLAELIRDQDLEKREQDLEEDHWSRYVDALGPEGLELLGALVRKNVPAGAAFGLGLRLGFKVGREYEKKADTQYPKEKTKC